MSYRRRETPDARFAETLSQTERLAAVKSRSGLLANVIIV